MYAVYSNGPDPAVAAKEAEERAKAKKKAAQKKSSSRRRESRFTVSGAVPPAVPATPLAVPPPSVVGTCCELLLIGRQAVDDRFASAALGVRFPSQPSREMALDTSDRTFPITAVKTLTSAVPEAHGHFWVSVLSPGCSDS